MMHAAKKCGVPVRILHSHNTKLSTSIKKERIPQRRAYTEELKRSVYSAEYAGKNMTKIYEDLLASKLR